MTLSLRSLLATGFYRKELGRPALRERPPLTPEETQRTAELFAFLSMHLTDSPSFYRGLL